MGEIVPQAKLARQKVKTRGISRKVKIHHFENELGTNGGIPRPTIRVLVLQRVYRMKIHFLLKLIILTITLSSFRGLHAKELCNYLCSPAKRGLHLKEEKPVALPEGCTLLEGTEEEDALWLEKYRQNPLGGFHDTFCKTIAQCPMNEALQLATEKRCQKIAEPIERIRCIGSSVKAAMAREGYVCRHHAECMKNIMERLKLRHRFRTGYAGKNVSFVKVHDWIEVEMGDQIIIADGFNNIYYTCPKPVTKRHTPLLQSPVLPGIH